MNYSLAKKLKDAGFEIKDEVWYIRPDDSTFTDGNDYTGETAICFPTLSELIEACGDGFSGLDRFGKEWMAKNKSVHGGMLGATPEEAVASLWLKLEENKK